MPGSPPHLSGHTVDNDRQRLKRTSLAIIDPRRGNPTERAPDDFSVTAVIPVFNEVDVIEHTVRSLVDDGIHVRLVDSWSTDDTVARVRARGRQDMISIPRHPEHGPSETYDWTDLLRNAEAIAASIDDGWVIHHDADERRPRRALARPALRLRRRRPHRRRRHPHRRRLPRRR